MPSINSYIRSSGPAVAGAIALLILLPRCSSAAILTYYSSRSAFNTAEPGLPLEVFQPILAGLIPSPLSSASNDSDFPAGNILPGITLADTSGSDLYTTGGAIGLFFLEDTLAIGFNPGVFAFGADVFGGSGSTPLAGTLAMDVFSGTTDLTPNSKFSLPFSPLTMRCQARPTSTTSPSARKPRRLNPRPACFRLLPRSS